MKRTILCCALGFGMATLLTAQTIDKPAATVRLEKSEAITQRQFQQKVKAVETATRKTLSPEDRRKLLDLLVGEILINQAAVKDKITVSKPEMEARMKNARVSTGYNMNLNRELSETEFKQVVERSGMSWEEYQKQLERSIQQQKYVMQKKKPFFDSIKEPTSGEIQDFYQSNRTAFVSPDIVRFRHIFIDTHSLISKEDNEKALKRAEEILREIKNGASFEDMVLKYSDDKASRYRGGDFGYMLRDDKGRRQLLGKEFFEAPFTMKVGEISGVLKSNVGYHIIKIEEQIPFKAMSLEDKIPPSFKKTLREEIIGQLTDRKQAEAYQKALLEVLEDLKKKAEIRIFEDSLNW